MKDPSTLRIGERVRRERFLRAFTLEQMAAYLDISPSYLGAVERGVRPVSRNLLVKLHERLGVSYDYLWDGLDVTGTMISQYVRESSRYNEPINHKLDVLLNICNDDEKLACFNMIHTYLTQKRNSKGYTLYTPKSQEKPKENTNEKTNFR